MANVVYMDKVIWEYSFGKMNQSDPTSPKPNSKTVFPVASLTKVLTVRIFDFFPMHQLQFLLADRDAWQR